MILVIRKFRQPFNNTHTRACVRTHNIMKIQRFGCIWTHCGIGDVGAAQ